MFDDQSFISDLTIYSISEYCRTEAVQSNSDAVRTELKRCRPCGQVRLFVRSSVFHELYDCVPRTDWLVLEAPFFLTHMCELTRYVRVPIFIRIFNVIGLQS